MKLTQTKQCRTCPWRKRSRVADIPNYQRSLHESLISTIANSDGNISKINEPVRIMACHYSKDGAELECIGWLMNQLGAGNNIPLRIRMMGCSNTSEIKLDGAQKETFEETFE